MKKTTIIGIVLIVLGVVSLSVQGITFTRHEKILDIGPIEATREKKETIPLPPLLGGISLVGGIALVFAGAKGADA